MDPPGFRRRHDVAHAGPALRGVLHLGPPDPGVHDRASGCVPVVPAGAGPSFDAGGGGTAGLTGSRGRVPGAHRARGPAFACSGAPAGRPGAGKIHVGYK
ncbi:hypothetical protein SGPA1_10914 [Streptomyces misionensis JCM 4497]